MLIRTAAEFCGSAGFVQQANDNSIQVGCRWRPQLCVGDCKCQRADAGCGGDWFGIIEHLHTGCMSSTADRRDTNGPSCGIGRNHHVFQVSRWHLLQPDRLPDAANLCLPDSPRSQRLLTLQLVLFGCVCHPHSQRVLTVVDFVGDVE